MARPRTIPITIRAKERVERPRVEMKSPEVVPVVGTGVELVVGTGVELVVGTVVEVVGTVVEVVGTVVEVVGTVVVLGFVVVLVVEAVVVAGGIVHSGPVNPFVQLHKPFPSGPELHAPLVPQEGQTLSQFIPK